MNRLRKMLTPLSRRATRYAYRLCSAVLLASAPVPAAANAFTAATFELAGELSEEGWHEAAAIEYRRLALTVAEERQQAVFYWMAGWHYLQLGEFDPAAVMLDRAESADSQIASCLNLLRGENAFLRGDTVAADYHFDILRRMETADPDARAYAARRSAVLHLRGNRTADAAAVVRASPDHAAARGDALAAIENYRAVRDKRPRLGGWLGLIPGMGYVYAGEYANALRSALLNGIFIYGMADSARRENWGAFTVIAFFEMTWYTGSVYGGIDAAHRRNRRRLQDAEQAVMGAAVFEPVRARLPLLQLQFDF